MEELKKLKGDKPWIQFELELLSKVYPTNKVFIAALGKLTAKAAPATDKKVKPQTTTKGKGKTLVEVQPASVKAAGNTDEGKQMLTATADKTEAGSPSWWPKAFW